MKIIDNTPIENFDTDWGDPDGTGMKEKSLKQVQAFLKKEMMKGYTFLGTIKTTDTPITLTSNDKVFYIATEEGDYTNFGLGNISELSVVKSGNGSWSAEGLGIISQKKISITEFTYPGCSFNKDGRILLQSSYSMTKAYPIDIAVRAVGWDGGSQYSMRLVNFLDANYSYISSYESGRASGNISVDFSVIDIPENTRFVVFSKLNSIATEIFLKETPIEDTIFSDLGDITAECTNLNISLHIKHAVPDLEEYSFKIDWTDPIPDNAIVFLYKSNWTKSQAEKIGRIYNGQWFKVQRDDTMPCLYINRGDISSTPSDEAFNIKVSFKDANPLILENRVETLENALNLWTGKNIVVFGDSITEFKDGNGNTYSDYIQRLTSANIINCGIGGTMLRSRTLPLLSDPTQYTYPSLSYAALDVVNLVKSSFNVTEEDLNYREAAVNAAEYIKNNLSDNNTVQVNAVNNIDWNNVHAVVIMVGTNDWAGGSYGDETSTTLNRTVPAINEIIKVIMTNAPWVKIYWFTPIVRWMNWSSTQGGSEADFSDNKKVDALTLKEFSAMVFEAVSLHHIPICDMYNTLGWNMYNFDQFFSSTDGTHPTKGKGMEEIAKKIVSFINANKTF